MFSFAKRNMKKEFLFQNPHWKNTKKIDKIRKRDFKRIKRHTYLDYTGASLYPEKLIYQHVNLLSKKLYGNPHSPSMTAMNSTMDVERAKEKVLNFFNADESEYACIFTQNASNAIKLVAESYEFNQDNRFLSTFDNHNSVNGIREYANKKGSVVELIKNNEKTLMMNHDLVSSALDNGVGLFAYPAFSNFSGVKHPLEFVTLAQEKGWDVLLDVAAFVPTNKLNLQEIKPDFIPISFYKIFGYPTGIGCLLVKRTKMSKLKRPSFSGGNIEMASAQNVGWYFLSEDESAFEDGTINFTGIPAITYGLDYINEIGYDIIQERMNIISKFFIKEIEKMTYKNGQSKIKLYGTTDIAHRGATFALNVLNKKGEKVDIEKFEKAADKAGISLRTGCFCNPGTGEIVNGITKENLIDIYECEEDKKDSIRQLLSGMKKDVSVIRISFGYMSNLNDLIKILHFLKHF